MFLRAFATLLVTFWCGVSEGARAKTRTGLAFVVSHPSRRNKDPARMGHRAVATIFRIVSCTVFALRRTTSIVRFWELITCRVCPILFVGLVVCFVGFSGGAGVWGA